MVDLTRTVRFCVSPQESRHAAAGGGDRVGDNTFAGAPPMTGLGRYYELEVRCRGAIDPVTGYFLNIREIDRAVRETAVPAIALACETTPTADPAAVLRGFLPALDARLGGSVRGARWRLTPYYSVEMTPKLDDAVLLRQQFDFAAAHRLHAPTLSEAENRAVFGKCNNPHGHGHNYRLEPCVRVALRAEGRPVFTLADLERVVGRTILDRFDHKHLNDDAPEFAGLNPSVENIARVFFGLLAPAVRAAGGDGAELRSVTVWETDKTSCTYPAGAGAEVGSEPRP